MGDRGGSFVGRVDGDGIEVHGEAVGAVVVVADLENGGAVLPEELVADLHDGAALGSVPHGAGVQPVVAPLVVVGAGGDDHGTASKGGATGFDGGAGPGFDGGDVVG